MRQTSKISGIYQIINLVNNKSYVGLSVNISNRWKQHTFRVQAEVEPTSRIRAALKKYGLKQTVIRPGKIGNFEFKILETCAEEKLIEREKYWINKLKPEYNCNILTSPEYYQVNHSKDAVQTWVQYHNHDKENGFPAQDALKNKKTKVRDAYHYISSKKRSILYTQGDIIYLIVGIGIRNKRYYLWSKTKVEEIDFLENEELIYNAFGEQFYLNPPQLLNDIDGFQSFLKYCGNFGFGFLNISNHEFTQKLDRISNEFRLLNETMSFQKFIADFLSISF